MNGEQKVKEDKDVEMPDTNQAEKRKTTAQIETDDEEPPVHTKRLRVRRTPVVQTAAAPTVAPTAAPAVRKSWIVTSDDE